MGSFYGLQSGGVGAGLRTGIGLDVQGVFSIHMSSSSADIAKTTEGCLSISVSKWPALVMWASLQHGGPRALYSASPRISIPRNLMI